MTVFQVKPMAPELGGRSRGGLPFAGALLCGLPIVIVLPFVLGMAAPITRDLTFSLLEENQPVELLTFAALLGGGIYGLFLAPAMRRRGASLFRSSLFVLLCIGAIVVAMEEIAWGQWFFGFETPAAMKAINGQGELTLHNIRGMQGNTEWLRLAVGAAGLVGCALTWRGRCRDFMPAPGLAMWFLVIAAFSLLDLVNDYHPFGGGIQMAVNKMSEVVELLIALVAVIFIHQQMAHRRLAD